MYGFAVCCSPHLGWITLDGGCGPGLLPAIFSKLGCKAVGVDIDFGMFVPSPLHPIVTIADLYMLPFRARSFELITSSNLIFLLPEPLQALIELKRLLRSGGKLAMLNPSELLNHQAAAVFVNEMNMTGAARATLINWADRSEEHHRWTDQETRALYNKVEMVYQGSVLKVGPGFGRFSSGIA